MSLWTLDDIVEYLTDYLGGSNDGKDRRASYRAATDALMELVNCHKWSYLYKLGRVATVANYSTGTVTYDHCVTPEHEALTRNGWMRYEQLSVGDEILAYDHDLETCSWQPIQKIHTFEYDGKILDVRRKGRSVLRCTPNHRVPVFERYGHGHGQPRKSRKRWVLAKDLTLEHTTPLAAPIDIEDGGPLTPRLAAILSWCVTDGSNTFKRWGTPRIGQSPKANPAKCAEIHALTGNAPFVSKDGQNSYPVYKNDARPIKAAAADKADLPRLFCSFGVQQAEASIRAMCLAEASTNSVNDQIVFTQWGDNKPVAEAFQIACLLAGKAANIGEKQYHCRSFGHDYGMRTRYACPIRKSRGIKLSKQSEWVDYSGIVWCPQVATGAWVVRCNGAVMITGNSGGAYERMLTTTGTWPTWAKFGTVIIDDVHYDVEDRKSATIITLTETTNPGADVAALTTYEIYRDTYPAPSDVASMHGMIDVDSGVEICPIPLEGFLNNRAVYRSSGDPYSYTLRQDPNYLDTQAFQFTPSPSSARTFDYVYYRRVREPKIINYNTGKATVTAASATATLTGGGALDDRHIGSVIRLSSSVSDAPTGNAGDNPFVVERIIIDVPNSDTVTVDTVFDTAYTAVKYYVTDMIDIDQQVMLGAYKWCARKWLANDRRMQNLRDVLAQYQTELSIALGADHKVYETDQGGGGGLISLLANSAALGDIGTVN